MNINSTVTHFALSPFIHLAESEVIRQLKEAVATEKTASLQVIEYLMEVNARRLYAAQSCSTLFEYVVKELGYSEMQASERINSMRLLQDVPEIRGMLDEGALSITTAAQIQRFIRNEKKFSQEALSKHHKESVISLCANKSKREVEKILFKLHSDEAKIAISERMRRISDTHLELRFPVPDGVFEQVNEVRNLIGEISLATLFKESIALYLEHLKKKKHADAVEVKVGGDTFPGKSKMSDAVQAVHTRYVPRGLKRMLFARSNGQCEFVDPVTQNRCLSHYRVQIDHIVPFSLGGKTDINNLRHLCQGHNLRSAVEWFS